MPEISRRAAIAGVSIVTAGVVGSMSILLRPSSSSGGSITAPEGTVLRYRSNEGSESTAIDSEGDHDGTIRGAVYDENAIEGSHSLSFPNDIDEVDSGWVGPFDTDTFSVAAWIKLDDPSVGGQSILDTYSGSFPQVSLQINPNYTGQVMWRCWDSDGNGPQVTNSISTSQWHHVVGVRDDATIRLYLDGQLVASDEGASLPSDLTNAPVHIGRRPDDTSPIAGGNVDDLMLANTAWMDQQVSDLYSQYDANPPLSDSWSNYRTYYSSNPLITPSDNPDAGNEQYAFATLQYPNGNYGLYCKSDELSGNTETVIQHWESTDGTSWTLRDVELGPSDVSSDPVALSSPGAIYDPSDSMYYLWVRCEGVGECRLFSGNSFDNLTEASTTPAVTVSGFTWESTTPDFVILQDVLEYNGMKYAYGTYGGSGKNRCWYGTFDSDSWDATITPQGQILTEANSYKSGDYLQAPQVFQHDDGNFIAVYAVGGGGDEHSRETYTAVGDDPTSFTTLEDKFVETLSDSWRSRWAYSGSWIKQNGQGNRKLETINGSHRFFFNGQPTSDSNNGSIGLAEFDEIPDF